MIIPVVMWTPHLHLVLLYEGDESGSLDLDGLPGAVVEGDDEVEEVGLAQVGGRLLLEVRPAQARRDPVV